jgi:hypothetical protein
MTTLNIELSKNGVDRVRAGLDTVCGSEELGRLIMASALPLRLLNDAVVEHFNDAAAIQNIDEPEVWVSTDVDGEVDLPRKIAIQTGVLPRNTFDGPPAWFVEGVKKMFPDYGWDEVGKPLSRELLMAFHTPEYIAQHKNTSTEELNELHNAPYCTPMEEAAVSAFSSHVSSNRLFDHWGWVGESLVSEPYGCTQENLKDLITICEQLGWTFDIVGVSGHFPSATIRIEIRPR